MKNKAFIAAFIAVFVITGLYVPAPKAQALSCIADAFTVDWNLENSDIAFRGTVTSVTTVEPIGENNVAGTDSVTFSVSRYWKGDAGKTVTIQTAAYQWSAWAGQNTNTENRFYKVGQEYIVFASKENSKYTANVDCTLTGLVANVSADTLKELGTGKTPKNQGSNPTTPVTPEPVRPTPIVKFINNLTVGSTGNEVIDLQTFLETKGLLKMPNGVAKGYFGAATRAALARYQASVGITPAVGYFGPITRAKVNAEK